MLRQLRIHGFRGFDSFETELHAINVLLGPNSCGKSSVLQAVRLACSALTWTLEQNPEPKLDGDWIVVWWDWPISRGEKFLPSMPIEDLFFNHGEKPFSIELQFDDADFIQTLRVQFRYGRSEALRLDVRVKSREASSRVAGIKPKSKSLSPKLVDALMGKDPAAIVIPAFYGVVRDEPYVNDALLARRLNAGEQGHVVRNLIGRLANTKELNDFLTLGVGAEFMRTISGQQLQAVEELSAHYRDRNGVLELSSAGTGLVALAALHAAISWYSIRTFQDRPCIFLLDEPEAHLHPKLQGATGERVAKMITNFRAQAFIATHSVEMINRLGFRPDTLLLSVERTASPPVVRLTTENEVIERLESFCDLTPFTSLNLLRSRKIIFYEGRTDKLILECCARARFANDPSGLQRFSQWVFVELSGVTNADAKNVLKKALEPLVSVDKGAAPIRIIRVLDRDHDRAPTVGPELGTATIKEFDVVWSEYSIESLFLEPACLAAWLWYELHDYPKAPRIDELQEAVAAGVALANNDTTLVNQAAEQVFTRLLRGLTVGQLESDQKIIHLRREAEKMVKANPGTFQQGKARAKRILEHVRSTLPPSLRNRVRSDIQDILRYAASPSTLAAPALVPSEIAKLLQYMTS